MVKIAPSFVGKRRRWVPAKVQLYVLIKGKHMAMGQNPGTSVNPKIVGKGFDFDPCPT
jgi:hypothetical protein